MTRKVQCVLLGAEADGLDYTPYPGELGKRNGVRSVTRL